ncbi:hypothetical protein [Vulgatibacter sp.]|uniref:hypothetical protein n=1 Tax=Vulgatibacter sp. TaxID=1971226 RepID=UPI00356540DB
MEWWQVVAPTGIGVAGTLLGYVVKGRVDQRKHEQANLFDERIAAVREHEALLADLHARAEACVDVEDPDDLAEVVIALENELARYERLLRRTASVFDRRTTESLCEVVEFYGDIVRGARWYDEQTCTAITYPDLGQLDELRDHIEHRFRVIRTGEPWALFIIRSLMRR